MSSLNLNQIKVLRDKTKAGVSDCRAALEASGGDLAKAQAWLKAKGIASANKRTGREAKSGLVESYTHAEGRVGVIVELNCESDFVARTDEFKTLAHELALQIAAMNPKDLVELLSQPYIRDEKATINSLVKEISGKTGENIIVARFQRFELGVDSK